MNLFNSNKDIWQTVGHKFIPAFKTSNCYDRSHYSH